MKQGLFILFILLAGIYSYATPVADTNVVETPVTLTVGNAAIEGTLTRPADTSTTMAVALLIAGSGPTDRNGNSIFTQNDALKKLAWTLAANHIASVRYDKRGVAKSMKAMGKEVDLRFDDYVTDVREWIKLLKQDRRFSKVIVIGHSEGALIGLLAAAQADQYISIAGIGRPAPAVLREQLSKQPPAIRDTSLLILDSLSAGKTVDRVPILLFSSFRPSVQPYLISWFKYDPQVEIAKLKIPVLILQGTNDLQVTTEDANLLKKGNPKATLVIVNNMNHVLREVTDEQANMTSYKNPALPLAPMLVQSIIDFIKKK